MAIPLIIDQPSIAIKAEQNGAIGLNPGLNGNVTLAAVYGGSIYPDGEGILFIIQSKPPVWQSHGPVSSKTPYGYMDDFKTGEVGTECLNVTYSVVAGFLLPDITLRAATGTVSGIIPDADATYVFTVRADDRHGKYAENIFRIVTRVYWRLVIGKLSLINPLGIGNSLKYVKDAQLSGYNLWSFYAATCVSLDGGSAWYGIDATPYFQVDFVLKLKKESGVVVQFCNCRYSPAWLFSSATADRVRCDCSVLQLQIESGVLVQFCNCG
ncbi:uncharacterized protein LOC127840457 [Dreissena polymorpha]|uniref:uncharacterized protein LOC127840457 n=1 Tax=Dreissena polymorpha TaxID=45954 RepID=UPI00226423E1|nr:uncharacterized protein LOC127840457 [Dreissena polymorpha]